MQLSYFSSITYWKHCLSSIGYFCLLCHRSGDVGSLKKWESPRKIPTSALLNVPKPWILWITTNCGKFLRCEYQATLPASWETCMQVKKQQLELDLEEHIGSKLGKGYVKAVFCHPAYLTSMKGTLWEMLDWMKQKLESTLLGEISIH